MAASVASVAVALAAAWATHSTHSIISSARMEVEACLYYGGADSCIALATGSIRGLLAWLEKDGKPDNACKE